jgi:WD40 repeat protein
VQALAFHPGGGLLLSGSDDKTIKLWSMPDGALLGMLWPNEPTLCLAINPEGSILASGHESNLIFLWSLSDGQRIKTVRGHGSAVRVLAINPQGDLLASGGDDKTVKLWALPGGRSTKTMVGHEASVSALSINSDGTRLASGDANGVIKLWSMPDGELLATITDPESSKPVQALKFSPDGQTLAAGNEWTIKFLSVSEGQTQNQYRKFSNTKKTAFSEDFSLFATSMYNTSIQLLSSGNIIADLEEPPVYISALAFSPNGDVLATGDQKGTIRLWAVQEGREKACLFDPAANPPETEGARYSVEVDGKMVEYTLPCGAPIPPGAVCICNCVASTGCSCVGNASCSCDSYKAPCSCVGDSSGNHYWYPN